MSRLHARGWCCISASEAAELTLAGKRAAKTFCLTFDDGFRDFAELAHPIIQDLGFTATVFVVTDRIGGSADWSTFERGSLLDADEIRCLVREGVSFGSHSRTHLDLPRCTERELRDELSGSRTMLSEVVGREVTTIAWPYGSNNESTRRAAEEAGYGLGYSVAGDGRLTRRVRNTIRPAARDRFAVPRREVRGRDSSLRRRLRMGPADGLFVSAQKVASASGDDS
jgi:peptidoglycan/xylan/chitin deacetylase (PgdA/CDA1 family)